MNLRRGLVLHLDPDVLEREGAYSHLVTEATRVRGLHWFICMLVDGEHSVWTPLFSRNAGKRIEIPKDAKLGGFRWRMSTTYADPGQMWVATEDQIAAAERDLGADAAFKNAVEERVLRRRLNSPAITALYEYRRKHEHRT